MGILTILIIIGVVAILLNFFEKEIYSFFHKERFPYKRKDFLLNVSERKFFENLEKIIPDDYVVFPQIVLGSIVEVTASRKDFWKYRNKINRKIVDFVIFEKKHLKPILVIEYDGKTHERKDRQERDSFVDKVLESSGIMILHVKHQKSIDFEKIGDKIKNLLEDYSSLN